MTSGAERDTAVSKALVAALGAGWRVCRPPITQDRYVLKLDGTGEFCSACRMRDLAREFLRACDHPGWADYFGVPAGFRAGSVEELELVLAVAEASS